MKEKKIEYIFGGNLGEKIETVRVFEEDSGQCFRNSGKKKMKEGRTREAGIILAGWCAKGYCLQRP